MNKVEIKHYAAGLSDDEASRIFNEMMTRAGMLQSAIAFRALVEAEAGKAMAESGGEQ